MDHCHESPAPGKPSLSTVVDGITSPYSLLQLLLQPLEGWSCGWVVADTQLVPIVLFVDFIAVTDDDRVLTTTTELTSLWALQPQIISLLFVSQVAYITYLNYTPGLRRIMRKKTTKH